MTLFSIGHSNHTIEAFLDAAKSIDVIVDVRSHPTSYWEHFRQENMKNWLSENGIEYQWFPDLGGWTRRHYAQYHEAMAAVGVDVAAYSRGVFPKERIGHDRPGTEQLTCWRNQGLFDYSYYTTTTEFLGSACDLIDQYAGSPKRAAIMCSEALWWKCHRSMIADFLTYKRVFIGHLPPKPPKRPTTRRFTPHQEVLGDRLLRYDPAILRAWAS